MSSKHAYRAEKLESDVTFWGELGCEECEGDAPLTVLGQETYVKVIYKGRVGLVQQEAIKKKDQKSEREVEALEKENHQAIVRLGELHRFPSYPLPLGSVKPTAPYYVAALEEAIECGFPVPGGLIQETDISDVLLAVLHRPHGVRMAAEIVSWATDKPHLVSRIPPLLSDFPNEVRMAFFSEARKFLRMSASDPGTWIPLFRAAIGLPPDDAPPSQGESKYQPYGAASKRANFHPELVFKNDVQAMRIKLQENTTDFRIATSTSDVSGGKRVSEIIPQTESSKGMVFTRTTSQNVGTLCKALQSHVPLLIEGDTGVGKTASVAAAAKRSGRRSIRFNLSSSTTVEDLVGRMQLTKGKLELSHAPFTDAFTDGALLVLDECNLAQEEVLATLETALDTGLLMLPDPSNPARAAREVRRHPGFRLIITQNPCSGLFKGKRQSLSAAFLSRFHPVKLLELPDDELVEIACSKLAEVLGDIPASWIDIGKLIVGTHLKVVHFVNSHKKTSIATPLTVFSIRDIINSVKLMTAGVNEEHADVEAKTLSVLSRYVATAWCTYGVRFHTRKGRSHVSKIIEQVKSAKTTKAPAVVDVPLAIAQCLGKSGGNLPNVGDRVWSHQDENASTPKHPIVVTDRFLGVYRQLDFVMDLGRPVLLVGKSGIGTSSLLLSYAALRTRSHYLCNVNNETVVGNLLGQQVPDAKGKGGSVSKWVDGPVTSAALSGKWLVLDDLPSASATVLERLNSVLEEQPELYVAERGPNLEQEITIKEGFRVLASADFTQLGSLSPAFANRFTILTLDKVEKEVLEEELRLLCSNLLFAPNDTHWSRKGTSAYTYPSGRVRVTRSKDKYSNAIVDMPLTASHEWDVIVGDCPIDNTTIGVALDNEALDMDREVEKCEFVWVYCSNGKVAHGEDGENKGVIGEPYSQGDKITVKVHCSQEVVQFFKNGVQQGSLGIKGAINKERPLVPFVGLYSKGSSVVLSLNQPSTKKDDVSAAARMCSSMAGGAHGVYSVVRAMQCARRFAVSSNSVCDLSHFRKALSLFIEMTSWFGGSPTGDYVAAIRSRGSPSMRAILDVSGKLESSAPSLGPVSQRITWCLHQGIPVVVIDDYHWNISELLLREIETVIATPRSSLSEWLGTILPRSSEKAQISINEVDGPLLRALKEGKIFTIAGLDLLPGAVQSQLMALIDTGMLSRPGEDTPLPAASGFCIVGECASSEAEKMASKFASKFVKITLPMPKKADYLALLGGSSREKVADAIVLFPERGLPMNVRYLKKVLHRMDRLEATRADASFEFRWCLCYTASLLSSAKSKKERSSTLGSLCSSFSELGLLSTEESGALSLAANEGGSITEADGKVSFTTGGLRCVFEGAMSRHPLAGTSVQLIKDVIVLIAHMCAADEPALLVGPTSCKSLAAKVFCAIIGKDIETIHLTCSTEEGDLVGSIHPFSQSDYVKAVADEEALLAERNSKKEGGLDGWAETLCRLKAVANKLEGEKGSTVFAVKDGPLSDAAKQGCGILLKAANLPDPQLFISLRDVFHNRELPLGIFAPPGASVPLKTKVPLVLTATCPVAYSLPSVFRSFTAIRCFSYSEDDTQQVLKSLLGGLAAAELLAKSIMKVLPNTTLRKMLRLAKFVAQYPQLAGIDEFGAFVLGAKHLFQLVLSPRDLEPLAWDAGVAERSLRLLPADDLPQHSTMSDYVKLREGDNVLEIHAGQVLGVARCFDPANVAKRLQRTSMVPISSMLKNLSSVFAASTLRIPMLLEGVPGIGKSFIVESTAKLLGCEFVRVQFSAGTTTAHLFGAPIPTMEGGVRVFKRREGQLGAALRKAKENLEYWILLDELNLAPPEVQQVLSPLLEEGADERIIPGTREKCTLKHIRFFAAVNPAKVGGGRSHLPPSVKDLFTVLTLHDLECSEGLHIARHKFCSTLDLEGNQELENELFKQLAYVHSSVTNLLQQGKLGVDRETYTSIVNLRTLEKVILLLEARLGKNSNAALKLKPEGVQIDKIKEFFVQVIEVIYKWRYPSPQDRATVSEVLANMAKSMKAHMNPAPSIVALGHGGVVMFGQAGMLRSSHESNCAPLPPSGELRHRLSALASASGSSLAVLLEGPTASGKTALVRELARICGQRLRIIPITPNTEISELLGMWVPWNGLTESTPYDLYESLGCEASRIAAAFISAKIPESPAEEGEEEKEKRKAHEDKVAQLRDVLLKHLDMLSRGKGYRTRLVTSTLEVCAALQGTIWGPSAKRLEELHKKIEVTSFHFAESQLIHAMQEGDWVLLDNIDWAQPAAIERLNSLLEADATFTLTERGDDEVKATKENGIHKNFRMFFTANPTRKHAAKLSTAFLNRVVRLAVKPFGADTEVEAGSGTFRSLVDNSGLPNVLFSCLDPDSADIRFWQYVFSCFHKRAQVISSDVCVRVLQHCLERWKDDIASYSTTHSSVFLLCSNLLSTYSQLLPKSEAALRHNLREILAEAYVLNWRPKRKSSTPARDKEPPKPPTPPPPPLPVKEEDEMDTGYDYMDYDSYDDDSADDDAKVTGNMDESQGINGGVDKIPIPGNIKKLQDACLANLKQEKMIERSQNEDFEAWDKKELLSLANELSQMWSNESGKGVVEELLDNLKSPENTRKSAALFNLVDHQCMLYKKCYEHLTPVHMLCMRLYTMEGPDIDSAMGYENVPKWSPAGTKEDNKPFRDYKARVGNTRNPTLYSIINKAMRQAISKDENVKLEARLVIKQWIKFICLLLTLCEDIDSTTVYRGLNVDTPTMEAFKSWEAGKLQGWPAATSTSRRRVDEFCFGDGKKVAFTIKEVKRGLEMKFISAYAEEEEVLLPPFCLLKVDSLNMNPKTKTLEIGLTLAEMVCWDDQTLRPFLERVLHDASQGVSRLRRLVNRRSKNTEAKLAVIHDFEIPTSTVSKIVAELEYPKEQIAATSEGMPPVKMVATKLADGLLSTAQSQCDDLRGAIKNVIDPTHELCNVFSYAPLESSLDALSSLLPHNVFTRAEAASSGVELHIPGLIKAMTTNFTYNKVFARRSAGGRRSYSVAIAFDAACISDSRVGTFVRLFAHLRSSIAAVDLDPTVVLYHGSETTCVHTSGEWDNYSVHAFVSAMARLKGTGDASGDLGDPLKLTASLLNEMKGKKKYMFVVTPGGTPLTDPDIAGALHICDANSIETIGVGLDAYIHMAMPKALSVTAPELLGHGLARFMQGPYAPPAMTEAGKVEVEEEQVFWGRHHIPIKVEGFSAKLAAHNVPANIRGLVLGETVVTKGQVRWKLNVTGGMEIGIGSSKVHLVVDITKLTKDAAVFFEVGSGLVVVTLNMDTKKVKLQAGNKTQELSHEMEEAQLMVCFTDKGGEVTLLPDEEDIETTTGVTVVGGRNLVYDNSLWDQDSGVEVVRGPLDADAKTTYQQVSVNADALRNGLSKSNGYLIRLSLEVSETDEKPEEFKERLLKKGKPFSDSSVESQHVVLTGNPQLSKSSQDVEWKMSCLKEAKEKGVMSVQDSRTFSEGSECPWSGWKYFITLEFMKISTPAFSQLRNVSFPIPSFAKNPFDELGRHIVIGDCSGHKIPHNTDLKRMWSFTPIPEDTKNRRETTIGFIHAGGKGLVCTPVKIVSDEDGLQHDIEGERRKLPSNMLVCVFVDIGKNQVMFGVNGKVLRVETIDAPTGIVPFVSNGHGIIECKPYTVEEEKGWIKKSPDMDVSGDTLKMTRNSYAAAMRGPISQGVHVWNVTIDGGVNGSTVGVCTEDCVLNSTLYRKPTTWVISNHGKASHGSENFEHPSFSGSPVVTCTLDMDSRTLAFAIDGTEIPEKFGNLPPVVHPLVGLYTDGCKATFTSKVSSKKDSEEQEAVLFRDWTVGEGLEKSDDGTLTSGGQKQFKNARGLLIQPDDEYELTLTFNGKTNGCYVGFSSEATKDLNTPIFRTKGSMVYSNHGTLVGENKSNMNSEWPTDDCIVKAQVTSKEICFSVGTVSGKLKKQTHTISRISDFDGAKVPLYLVVGLYDPGATVRCEMMQKK